MITQARLRELLHYDPDTGVFTWAMSRPGVRKGSVAGCLNTSTGYWIVKVDRVIYSGHRLAWLYMNGTWPVEIDHEDTNKANNRWKNLREATESQNGANKKVSHNNALGVKGVHRYRDKFRASICVKGKQIHLGTFANAALAKAAYDDAARVHFGEFARS